MGFRDLVMLYKYQIKKCLSGLRLFDCVGESNFNCTSKRKSADYQGQDPSQVKGTFVWDLGGQRDERRGFISICFPRRHLSGARYSLTLDAGDGKWAHRASQLRTDTISAQPQE